MIKKGTPCIAFWMGGGDVDAFVCRWHYVSRDLHYRFDLHDDYMVIEPFNQHISNTSRKIMDFITGIRFAYDLPGDCLFFTESKLAVLSEQEDIWIIAVDTNKLVLE